MYVGWVVYRWRVMIGIGHVGERVIMGKGEVERKDWWNERRRVSRDWRELVGGNYGCEMGEILKWRRIGDGNE